MTRKFIYFQVERILAATTEEQDASLDVPIITGGVPTAIEENVERAEVL